MIESEGKLLDGELTRRQTQADVTFNRCYRNSFCLLLMTAVRR